MKRILTALLLVMFAITLGGCDEDISRGTVTWFAPDGVRTWENVHKVEIKDSGKFIFEKDGKKIIIYGNILTEGN